MELIFDKVKELTEEQFEALLVFIGYDSLKKALIDCAGSFHRNSPYYLGARTTGTFWSGFRKEKIPANRVKKFYMDEVFKEKTNLNTTFFKNVILSKVSKIENFSESFILECDNVLRSTLCLLYDIEINEETEKHLNKINEILKENENKINELKKSYENQIEKMIDEIHSQKQDYEKIIKDLKKQIEKINKQNIANNTNLLKRVMDYTSDKGLSARINSLNLEDEKSVKLFMKESFNNNLKELDLSDFTKLANELTIQYIITKIMEAK